MVMQWAALSLVTFFRACKESNSPARARTGNTNYQNKESRYPELLGFYFMDAGFHRHDDGGNRRGVGVALLVR